MNKEDNLDWLLKRGEKGKKGGATSSKSPKAKPNKKRSSKEAAGLTMRLLLNGALIIIVIALFWLAHYTLGNTS